MPYRLAAFGDEISPDIQVQMDHLAEAGIKFIAMRSAHSKNILDLEEYQVPLTRNQFANRGFKFVCIAPAVCLEPLADPQAGLERFKLACRRAKEFDTRVIRIGGMSRDAQTSPSDPAAVVARLKACAAHAQAEGLNLLLKNEAGTFADTAEACASILEGVAAPNLMAAFDFGQFVLCGEDPRAAWPRLKRWVKDFNIQDRRADREPELPGRGEGHIEEVLKDAFLGGWSGLVTLQPNLRSAVQYPGLGDAERFRMAHEALQSILQAIGT